VILISCRTYVDTETLIDPYYSMPALSIFYSHARAVTRTLVVMKYVIKCLTHATVPSVFYFTLPGGATTSKSLAVCTGEMSSFAALHAPAATAGTPGPGKLESPTTNNPLSGVDADVIGNVSLSSEIQPVPPYVPRLRRRNRACVNGVPTMVISARARTSGIAFSTARHSTCERSAIALASALL
jgi:hypothetical protein